MLFFTFERGKIKIKISCVSPLCCHCHFVLSAKKGFSEKKLSIGTEKKC